MSVYKTTRLDVFTFHTQLKYDLPLAVDDMSLAFHLGIRNKTLWWLIHTKDSQYKTFEIPKKSGGTRKIQHPSFFLKNVQRVLLARFLAPIPVGKHIGAYVIGRSCMETARQHVQHKIIISLDIKDFFPSIKRAKIRRFFNYVGYPHRVSSLLAELMTYKNFVPQGAPTSGMLANVVADNEFDQAILRDLRELDPAWCYTRYSDDIDVSHPEKQSAAAIEKVIEIVKQNITAAGFKINMKKLRKEPYWRQQRVLGIVVNEKPNIARDEYMRIRAIIHNCLMHGIETQYQRAKKESPEALIQYLRGKINYFSQIAPEKAARLKDELALAELRSSED